MPIAHTPTTPTPRRAFTLIELMIVIVIIGILAAIAVPKFTSNRGTAYVTQMKSDLRNLATAQEGYYQDWQVYASASATSLVNKAGAVLWTPTTGTTLVGSGTAGSATGWNAQVRHAGSTQSCSLYFGTGGTGAFASSGQAAGDVTCY